MRTPVGWLLIFAVGPLGLSTLSGCRDDLTPVAAGPLAPLPAADVSLPLEFTQIGTVRELADGRLLVADERDNRLGVVDFAAGSIELLGRTGEGPEEYRKVGPLMPLAADSTLMLDLGSRRWLLLEGGAIVATVATSDPAVAVMTRGLTAGADARGGAIGRLWPAPAVGAREDSLVVVRVDRSTGAVDTLARASSAEQGGTAIVSAAEGAAPADRRPTYVMSIMSMDEVAVFPDGWVAIARVDPYRVDWCPPGEECRIGPSLRGEVAPLSDAEKMEYLSTAQANSSWPPTMEIEETTNWPAELPPFGSFARRTYPSALTAAPDGRLLIQRLPTPAEPAMRYDVIDRDGRIASRIALPVNAHIVGASAEYLYVATVDELAIQRLSRHRWP